MTNASRSAATWPGSMLRRLMWAAAAALLLAPAVAMQLTDGVRWTALDFVFMGVLLAAAGAAMEVGMRLSGDGFHRAGMAAAVGGGFVLVWANAAVGLVGSEADAFNLPYLGVVAVAIAGAVLARLRAAGMARAMAAALATHLAIGAAALATGRGDGVAEVAGVTAVFALPWLLAGGLFRAAAGRAAHAAT